MVTERWQGQRRVARSCSFSGDMEVETLAGVPMVEMPGDKLQW